MADRTQNHNLDDDALLQIFSCYRLEDEDNWYHQLSWLTLVHVCRKWRYLIYGSWSYLDVCHLITHNSTSMDPPGHLPHLPLVIACSDRTNTMTRSGEDNIHLGLQYGGRIRRVALRAPSSSLRMWLEQMNKHFPRLQALSLFSTTTEDMSLVLSELLQAPELRHLSLHGVGLPKRLSLLSSMISLSTLSLTHIRGPWYFPPGHLVTQLQGLPYLEELSVGIALPIPLPISEGKLFPSPTSPVLLRTLKRLTFRGEDGYLDDLVARINTPLLKQLDLTLLFDLAFTLVNLTEFIHRTERFRCLVAQVIFNKGGVYINTDTSYHEEQDNEELSLYVSCESVDWKIHSAVQVCSALEKVLSSVEELTLDLDEDGMPSDWKNKLFDELWHDLLLPFIGVKKLRIGPSLTLEISQGLDSLDGALVLDLLPKLEELEVPLALEFGLAQTAFSMFVKTRGSVGRPVHRLPTFPPPVLRCRLCRRLSQRHEVERLGGFCSERHKRDWLVVIILPLFRGQQLTTILRNHFREKGLRSTTEKQNEYATIPTPPHLSTYLYFSSEAS
jgi:hypothetical protein